MKEELYITDLVIDGTFNMSGGELGFTIRDPKEDISEYNNLIGGFVNGSSGYKYYVNSFEIFNDIPSLEGRVCMIVKKIANINQKEYVIEHIMDLAGTLLYFNFNANNYPDIKFETLISSELMCEGLKYKVIAAMGPKEGSDNDTAVLAANLIKDDIT